MTQYTYPKIQGPSRTHDLIVALRKRGVKIYRAPGGLYRNGKKIMTAPEFRAWGKRIVLTKPETINT